MRDDKKRTRNDIIIIVGILIITLIHTKLADYIYTQQLAKTNNPDTINVQKNETEGVILSSVSGTTIKSVFHTYDPDDPRYELIAYNPDLDVAIYSVNDIMVDIKDRVVTIDGIEGTVTYVDMHGFAFMPDNPDDIVPGMSGSGVRNEDFEQVGIISGKWSNGEVYCIWS